MGMVHRLMFEYLVPSWWNHLGRIPRDGLVGGGVSLGVGFAVSKDLCHSQYAVYFLFMG